MRSRLISMLLTGLVLAVLFLAVVQVTQTVRNRFFSEPTNSPQVETTENIRESFKPVIIQSVSEDNDIFFINGTSEPSVELSVQNFGNEVKKINSDEDGNWTVDFNIAPKELLQIDVIEYILDKKPVSSDETVHRIPPPELDEASPEQSPRSLIMITAPGGPSSIFQSPFRGLPTSEAISLGSIDYDDSGGVIFSGTSMTDGRVRIYANDTAIGERRVQANGRWYIIAADTLPRGGFDIRAEVITSSGINSEIKVPFKRIMPNQLSTDQSLEVFYQPFAWQVRRSLKGGGNQYTAIFAPEEADPIVEE